MHVSGSVACVMVSTSHIKQIQKMYNSIGVGVMRIAQVMLINGSTVTRYHVMHTVTHPELSPPYGISPLCSADWISHSVPAEMLH